MSTSGGWDRTSDTRLMKRVGIPSKTTGTLSGYVGYGTLSILAKQAKTLRKQAKNRRFSALARKIAEEIHFGLRCSRLHCPPGRAFHSQPRRGLDGEQLQTLTVSA